MKGVFGLDVFNDYFVGFIIGFGVGVGAGVIGLIILFAVAT